MKGRGTATAGSYAYDGGALVTGWHAHEVHQIEYAIGGVVEVETPAGHYLVPPQQAIWLPAGLEHDTHLNGDVTTLSVLFDPGLIAGHRDRARILAVSPLMREMLLHSLRWPLADSAADPRAERFFLALADVVVDALAAETPLLLPTSDDPLVSSAMRYTRDLPPGRDRPRSLDDCRHQRTGGDELEQRTEEGLALMFGVVAAGQLIADLLEFEGAQGQPFAFDTSDDVADQVAGHAVGLDEYESPFSHVHTVTTGRRPVATSGRSARTA